MHLPNSRWLTTVFSILLSLPLFVAVARAEPGAAPPPIEEALQQAAKSGKPLLLEFSTTWCEPCKLFDKNVLPDPSVQKALQDFIFVQYDAEAGPGVAAATRFSVQSYPTFLGVDAQGAVCERSSGMSAETGVFVRFAQRAAASALSEETLKARLQKEPKSARLQVQAGRWYEAHQRPVEALAAYKQALTLDPKDQLGQLAVAMWKRDALHNGLEFRRQLVKRATELSRRFPGSEPGGDALVLSALSGDVPAAEVRALVKLRLEAVKDDAEMLNELCDIALAAGAVDEAMEAAKRHIALRKDDGDGYQNLAAAHHYRGERDEAMAAAATAMEKAKDDPTRVQLKQQLAIFIRGDRSPLPGIEAQRKKVSALFKTVRELHIPTSSEAAPGISSFLAYRAGMEQALKAAAQRCRPLAAQLPDAYVRLEQQEDGGKPGRVVVLEPEASPQLQKCLVEVLSQQVLPKPQAFRHDRGYVSAVRFLDGPSPGAPPSDKSPRSALPTAVPPKP